MVVAVYCRLSKQADGSWDRTETQEKRARSYVAQHLPDRPVVVFSDPSASAADETAQRPGYDALLAAVRRGDVNEIVTAEQSRITRRPEAWEQFMVACSKVGIDRLHTYRNGPLEFGQSKLVGRIFSAVSAEEVEQMRRRINDALADRAARGIPPGGASYGYRHERDSTGRAVLVVDEAEAQTARWAADAVLSGWSLSAITRELEARGAPTRRGGKWSPTTVRTMLTSPTIAGLRVHRGEIVGAGAWEPIVSRDTFDRVGAILRGRRRHRSTARKYLLSAGIAVCAKCGAALQAQKRDYDKRRGARPAYNCPPPTRGGCNGVSIGAAGLEDHVRDTLLAAMDRPEFWEAFTSSDDVRRADLQAEADAIEARRTELARLWAAGDLSAAEWTEARGVLDDEAERVAAELADLPATTVERMDPAVLRQAWSTMTLDEQRAIVAMFIARVVIGPAKPGTRRFDPGRVVIEWRTV